MYSSDPIARAASAIGRDETPVGNRNAVHGPPAAHVASYQIEPSLFADRFPPEMINADGETLASQVTPRPVLLWLVNSGGWTASSTSFISSVDARTFQSASVAATFELSAGSTATARSKVVSNPATAGTHAGVVAGL